jgi:hypothetical protein
MASRRPLARVARLERARTPTSPIALMYGSLDAFTDELRAGIAAGVYDARDMPHVIVGVERWHREGVWAR